MPDKRTTELTAIDVVTSTDLVMVVDDPSGTAVSKKATVTQVLVNTAKTNAPNTFVGDQTIDGDLVVTGEINPVRLVAQLAKVDALEGRAVGNTTGSRTLLSKSMIAGLSMRHDEAAAQATITVGNYDTQIYQPMLMQQESLRILTGLSPVIAEHVRVHPSGGVTVGTVHLTDPGVGVLSATTLVGATLDLKEGVPLDPSADTGRLYALDVNGYTQVEMRDAAANVVRFASDNILIAKVNESAGIQRGQCLYIQGATGANPLVGLARADTLTTLPTVGLALDPGAMNAFIRVLLGGTLQKLNTSAFAEGARLFVSPTTAGSMTTTQPVAPNYAQRVGFVTRSHATAGEVLVVTTSIDGPPRLHATTHETGGTDALTALSAGILTSGTLVDARLSANVLKFTGGYPGGATTFLRADGTFAAPPPSTHATTHNTGGNDALTALSAAILTSGSLPDARLSVNVLKFTGGYPGGTTTFLRADGTFVAPSSTPAAHQATHRQGGSDPVDVKTLAGFPGDGSLFLNGLGSFSIPAAPANVAYKNVDNNFTVLQTLPGLTVTGMTQVSSGNPGLKFGAGVGYPALRAQTSGAVMLEATSADTPSSVYVPFKANYFIAMAAGNSFPDLTITGSGLTVLSGNLAVSSGVWKANLFTDGGFIYPGRVDIGGAPTQGAWYLAGHGSYGLYTNAGFYVAGNIWSGTAINAPTGAFSGAVSANTLTSTAALTCGSIECAAHVRWAGGNYWSWDGAAAFMSAAGHVRLIFPSPSYEFQVPGLIHLNGAGTGALLVNDEYQNFRIDCDTTRYYFRGPTASVGANSFFPVPANGCWNGNATFPWYAVSAYVGTIQPSDATIKNSIHDSDLGLAFVEKLRPRRYKFNHDPTQEHIGFTTQEVEAAMGGRRFAVVQHPEEHGQTGPSGLNYAGFVPVLTKAIQELSARLRTLEAAWKN